MLHFDLLRPGAGPLITFIVWSITMPFDAFRARRPKVDLHQKLAQERPNTSLIERELAPVSGDFVFDKTDWVPLWMDRRHRISSDCQTLWAYRAITLRGQLLWYVFTARKTRGYHATPQDPLAAMEDALDAWEARREVRRR